MQRCRFDCEARYPAAAHMLCGPTQGRLLHMLCKLVSARRALEVGTFCGYGSLWLASALGAEGELVTVERDPAAASVARAHLARAAEEHPTWANVRLVEADRAQALAQLAAQRPEPFDLVYLDADKKGYADCFDLVLDAGLLRPGGVIVADNTLWKGRILGVENARRKITLPPASLSWC